MNMPRRQFTKLAALAAAAPALSKFVTVRAMSHDMAMGDSAHPSHIHTGTCAAPGEVVFPLSNVGSTYDTDGTPTAGEWTGPESAVAVDAGVTTVQASLADIVSGGHTIVVHESAEKIDNYIACGDVGGMMLGNQLPIGLGPLNDSGYTGVALLTDNGDGTTSVAIFLTESGEDGEYSDDSDDAGSMDHSSMGTPAAMTSGGDVQADITNFAFNPGTIEIMTGGTITWTNNDSAPHTVSQTGGGFESGKLDQGQTFTYTFDTAGSYDYYCQFHPNMKGTVVVS